MANTHLTFYQPCSCGQCDAPHQLDIILSGALELSPYVEVNGQAFMLSSSYRHDDGYTENVYTALFPSHANHD